MSAERVQAFLRGALRATWISIASVALAVVADLVRLPRLLHLVPLLCAVAGAGVCVARAQGRGVLQGLAWLAVSAYAGLVTLLLALDRLFIP